MTPISKEEFMKILESQQSRGLSIKDFCGNESYTVSSFHYWKSKFGLPVHTIITLERLQWINWHPSALIFRKINLHLKLLPRVIVKERHEKARGGNLPAIKNLNKSVE